MESLRPRRALTPSVTISTGTADLEDRIVGQWQDLVGSFFEGCIIDIHDNGEWRPQTLNKTIDMSASYSWRRLTSAPAEWELLQIRKDPNEERSYIVSTKGDEQLHVRLASSPSLSWCLDRIDPMSPKGLRVSATIEEHDVQRGKMLEARLDSFKRRKEHHVSWNAWGHSLFQVMDGNGLVDILICLAVIVNAFIVGRWILFTEDTLDLSSWSLSFTLQAAVLLTLLAALVVQRKWLKRPSAGIRLLPVVIFYFDLAMVVAGIIETIILLVIEFVPSWCTPVVSQFVECLRFVRLFHLLRISFRWLNLIIDAMVWLLSAACLLLLLLYVLGVLCTRLIGHSERFNENPELQMVFYTLGDSMFTLFSFCTFEDWTTYLRYTMQEGPYGMCITLCVLALMIVANLTIFNIAAAAMIRITNEMQALQQKRKQEKYEKHLEDLLDQVDSGTEITYEVFERIAPFCVEGAFSFFELKELFEEIDADKSGKLSLEELVDGLALLRSPAATSKQLFGLEKKLQKVLKSLGHEQDETTKKINLTYKIIQDVCGTVKCMQERLESAGRVQTSTDNTSAEVSEARPQAVKSGVLQQMDNTEAPSDVSPHVVSIALLHDALEDVQAKLCTNLQKCFGDRFELSEGRRADEHRQLLECVDKSFFKVVAAMHEAVDASSEKRDKAHPRSAQSDTSSECKQSCAAQLCEARLTERAPAAPAAVVQCSPFPLDLTNGGGTSTKAVRHNNMSLLEPSPEPGPLTTLRRLPPPLQTPSSPSKTPAAQNQEFQCFWPDADTATDRSIHLELPGAAAEDCCDSITAGSLRRDGLMAQVLSEVHPGHKYSSSSFVMPPPQQSAAVVERSCRELTSSAHAAFMRHDAHMPVELGCEPRPNSRFKLNPRSTEGSERLGQHFATIGLAPFVGTADRFGRMGRITGLQQWVHEHRLLAMPFDKLVLCLDAQGVELSTSEQDCLKSALRQN